MSNPRIAIATEFLTEYGGAQRVLEAIAEIYPDAPIYTSKYDATKMTPFINSRKIISPKEGFINKASKYFFTFLMAPVFESLDFKDFDIIISDGNTWTKGILTRPEQLHISYIHTPPRFLYKYSTESTKRDKWYFKLFFSYIDNILRLWDFTAAHRPDKLLANSKEIQSRIKKFYRLDSQIVYPPTDVNLSDEILNLRLENEGLGFIKKPYYLVWGRLVSFKRFDVAIKAFNDSGKTLVVAGTGRFENKLKQMANENIIFTGRVSERQRHALINNCEAVINTVEDEDFGIVPVEAMAHGKPVLGHNSGGHKETIIQNLTGMLYDSSDTESFNKALKIFEEKIRNNEFDKNKIIESVQKFSKDRFKKEIKEIVDTEWNKRV